MRRALGLLLGALLAATVTTPALAAPALVVTTSCAYNGDRFAVAGRGFDRGTTVALDVMGAPDAAAGAAVETRSATAGANGAFVEIFDVPAAAQAGETVRAVRARPPADLGVAPFVLASTSLRSVNRSAVVAGAGATAAAIQRWRLTGLPEGTPLYAHYLRRGRRIARRSLGVTADPCGRLAFDLRVLPRGDERSGAWELWITADRSFRRPRKGVYLRRSMTAAGSTARSRVRIGALTSRLAPIDPRLSAPATHGMGADASKIGLLSLTFVGAEGATVDFLERIGDRLVRLGTGVAGADEILTALPDATTWSCERPERRFLATATLPSGALALATYSVRTPACASRFALAAPRRAARGDVVRVRITDRWGIGAIKPQLCVTAPHARRSCKTVALGRAVTLAGRRFRAAARGDWVVQLRVRDRRVARAVVRVGSGGSAAPSVPTVLATGDSTMQGIDSFLADELGDAASVESDVRIGTGISSSRQDGLPGADEPTAVQWALLAAQQTARLRQRATVVSLGANEGFVMTPPEGAQATCCDQRWEAEYSRRTRLTMQAYARAGRVLWLTLPLPRDDRRAAITGTVNRAIVAAAAGVARVTVLRIDHVFSPDGFQEVIRYRGRDVDVRDVDGVHLNVAGTAIAAKIVAAELARR